MTLSGTWCNLPGLVEGPGVQGVLHTYPWAFWENILLSPGEHFAQVVD